MSLGKTLLFLSVPALLAPGAGAAAELSAPGGAVPAYFAREIVASVAAPRTLTTSASADTRLNWSLGYNFSSGEVRHARVECSDGLHFDAATTVASSDPGAASIGAINGLGTSVITFSLTSGNAANLIASSDDLEQLATEDAPDNKTLSGWRLKLFGETALALKRGDIALTVRNGKIAILP